MTSLKKLNRKNIIAFALNDKELEALNRYCEKYNITNRSDIIRKSLMTKVIGQLSKDSPTLF